MQQVVDTYQCEWKTAVTDPETRKRFRTFVNSDQPDENVVFVQERGQIRPASTKSARSPTPHHRPAARGLTWPVPHRFRRHPMTDALLN